MGNNSYPKVRHQLENVNNGKWSHESEGYKTADKNRKKKIDLLPILLALIVVLVAVRFLLPVVDPNAGRAIDTGASELHTFMYEVCIERAPDPSRCEAIEH